MSTSGPDPPQQTAFLTSASSSLATITSIDNGSSSALQTQTAMTSESSIPTGQPPLAPSETPTEAPPAPPTPTVPGALPSPTSPATSSPIVTELTLGEEIGIGIASAAVIALFLWW
ncbi:hypothetical protein JMJ35_002746 [Cladonia borealis]|uniref:Uncharacterized protein n=1 Tax=Cladonia borealis TaxID=184061 RepID=A0AA39V488_9LECA|nr:hypothetical protein JMJ35_002746 [Cladonia borealis]